jgi:hypothetical protein
MILTGLAITFIGFLIAVLSVGISSSVTGRLIIVLVGLAVCLFGIIGVLNRAYLKNALWKR